MQDQTDLSTKVPLKQRFADHKMAIALCLGLFLLQLSLIIAQPVRIRGDATEYLGMASSIIHSHNLRFEYEDITSSVQYLSPDTYWRDLDRGSQTLTDRQGDRVWGSHSFYFSLLAVPFILLFGAKGFLILNALCFVAAVWLLYLHLRRWNSPTTSIALAAMCLALATAPSYVFWIHAEMFSFVTVLAALYFALKHRCSVGGIFLGIAIAIKPPIAILLPVIACWYWPHQNRLKFILLLTVSATVVAAPQFIYNLYTFGSLNPLLKVTSSSHLSLERIITFWVGPGRGLLWSFPMVLWCLLSTRIPWRFAALMLGAAFAIATASSIQRITYTHEVGIRYALYVAPILFMLAGKWKGNLKDWTCIFFACIFGGALLLNPLGNIGSMQIYEKTFPSITIAHSLGYSISPEAFLSSAQRLPRYAAIDFADNENYLRDETAHIMIRKAPADDFILKLMPDNNTEPSEATLQQTGGEPISLPIAPKKITTFLLPIKSENNINTTFVRAHQGKPVEVAQLRLSTKLATKRGRGELRWQSMHRWGMIYNGNFLYHAGPRIVGLYPGRSWILRKWASEDLDDSTPLDIAETVASIPSNLVNLRWDDQDFIEGTHSIAFQVMKTPAVPGMLRLCELPITQDIRATAKIEIRGAIKVENFKGYADDVKAVVLVHLIDGEMKVIKNYPAFVSTTDRDWTVFDRTVVLPSEAATIWVSAGLIGAEGTVKLDDIILSKSTAIWD